MLAARLREMQKPKPEPITELDMRAYLDTQDDLRLELAALRVCSDHGWSVRHGGFYTDPITKKMRQFDLRAHQALDDMRICLTIECKALKDTYPLLLSRLPRSNDEAFHEVLLSHSPVSQGPMSIPAEDEVARTLRMDGHASAYKINEPSGKHTVQVRRHGDSKTNTGDAEAFEKWSQALASASDVIHDNATECESIENAHLFSVTLPVLLVANRTLWAVDYDSTGVEIAAPRKIESAEFFVGRSYSSIMPTFNYEVSHLHVVTLAGLIDLVGSFDIGGEGWPLWFPIKTISRGKE
jgi:hypothetical protein